MGTITHLKVSAVPPDPTADIKTSDWNDPHAFSLTKSDVGLGNVDNTSDASVLASAASAAAILYRPKLAADQTKNVPADFASLDAALAYAATIDFNGHTLTIQLANGTYTASPTFNVPATVGQSAPANLLIKGDTTTPSNVVLSSAVAFAGIVKADVGTRCRIQGIQFKGTGGSGFTFGIHAVNGGYCEFSDCDFGGDMFFHKCGEAGGTVASIGNYSISAGATAHVGGVNQGRLFDVGQTITLTGTPAWVAGYAWISAMSFTRISGCTFVGAATGQRYQVDILSMIQTDGGGAAYLPGNAPGAGAGVYS